MWAKIVNDEIMQLHDEDPTGLWHPDAIERNDIPGHWDQVPENVNIGWRYRDGEWISGGQWHEEWVAANPPPPPGPPTCNISVTDTKSTFNKSVLELFAHQAGYVDSVLWEINGTEYSDNNIEVEFDCADESYEVTINLTVSGPGGAVTDSRVYLVPKIFVPPTVGLIDR